MRSEEGRVQWAAATFAAASQPAKTKYSKYSNASSNCTRFTASIPLKRKCMPSNLVVGFHGPRRYEPRHGFLLVGDDLGRAAGGAARSSGPVNRTRAVWQAARASWALALGAAGGFTSSQEQIAARRQPPRRNAAPCPLQGATGPAAHPPSPHLSERLHAAAGRERRHAARAAERGGDADGVDHLTRRGGGRRKQRVHQPAQRARSPGAVQIHCGGQQRGDGGVQVGRERHHGRARQPVQDLGPRARSWGQGFQAGGRCNRLGPDRGFEGAGAGRYSTGGSRSQRRDKRKPTQPNAT
jgi:hypothetical protein